MVGGESPPGSAAAELTRGGVREAYDVAARGWADGPGLVYGALARALVACSPVPLPGASVLDLGAGTGAAARAAVAAQARRVAAADLAGDMLRLGGSGLLAVVADALRLPFRDGSFDLVVAAFALNHLGSADAGLREARRVGGAIAASMFAPGWDHPAKDAVDRVLRAFGYTEPGWHASVIRSRAAQAGDPATLARQAHAAGFTDVDVGVHVVDTDVSSPAELAGWRLGMAHVAPFTQSIGPERATALRRAAERAVAGSGPLAVSMVVLTGR